MFFYNVHLQKVSIVGHHGALQYCQKFIHKYLICADEL